MKTCLLILIPLSTLILSCGNGMVQNNTVESDKVDTVSTKSPVNPDNALLVQAYSLVDSCTYYVDISQAKKISVKTANKHINPLMKQVDALNNQMSAEGQAKLKAYRINQINKTIDKMVQ